MRNGECAFMNVRIHIAEMTCRWCRQTDFQHCLTPHCWMLQQKCYVMVIFVGFCCCTGKFSRTCMLQLLRFILRLSPCISRPGNFDRSASSTTYKWHIEVAVSLGPSSPLKWPGNAFLCVKCLSVNVIITDLRCFPTSLTAVWNLKFEILVRVFETEIRWASQRAYFCWLLIPASKVIC